MISTLYFDDVKVDDEIGPLVKKPTKRPHGCIDWGMTEFEAYGDDIEFHAEHQRATKEPSNLDAWLKEWVLDCPSHEDYLKKLGANRIAFLKGKVRRDFWEYDLPLAIRKVAKEQPYTATEMMIIAASRKTRERVVDKGYKVIVCGIGASGMAGWLAGYELKGTGHSVEIAMGNGMYGVLPRPADPMLVNVANMNTCKMIIDSPTFYDFIIAGETGESIAVLASGQVDKHGNLNSGRISADLLLQGPGGAGDACRGKDVIAVLRQQKDRFVDKVPYITSSGETVSTVVSSLGIFEKLDGSDELTLTACLPSDNSHDLRRTLRTIVVGN